MESSDRRDKSRRKRGTDEQILWGVWQDVSYEDHRKKSVSDVQLSSRAAYSIADLACPWTHSIVLPRRTPLLTLRWQIAVGAGRCFRQ